MNVHGFHPSRLAHAHAPDGTILAMETRLL